ncbi:MAG: hypothetical protein MJ197_07995 [Bacteroidales bacterium]|nr:hypothetical protein [Bacteroidales bacterium]
MKKLLVVALLSMFTMGAMAQHRAIGARLSNVVEVSYQRQASGSNFWEFDGGLYDLGLGAQVSAVHNWVIASPDWSPKGEWNWYLGVGASVATIWGEAYHQGNENLGIFAGVAGMVGLEYTFWFPLQLSADFRPVVGPYIGDGVHFNGDLLFHAFWPTISARYKF